MKKTFHKPGFALTSLSAIILSAALTGCLSSSGSSSSTSTAAEPVTESVPTASTQQGDFTGINMDGMRVFRGIRYGAAPEGELRFAAPQPAPAHDGTVELNESFGSNCPQIDSAFGAGSITEDCLFLNVYAPEEPGDYPVMLWIHGGAFVSGSGGPSYEPQRLVEQGTVVVTINYRLGALGFLPHADLDDSNFGLLDQQLAMQWVQDNIAAFDGDPDNVTIFGESAGGHSVMSQLASPLANGLFHKAIVQSGSYNGDQLPLQDIEIPSVTVIPGGQSLFGEPTIADTSCAGESGPALVDCLRELSVEDILTAQPSNIIPVTGVSNLPASINQALASGEFNQVPLIMGSNRDEGDLFLLLELQQGKSFADDDAYTDRVTELLSENPTLDAAAVAARYLEKQNPADPLRRFRAWSQINTDWRFNCPNDTQWSLLEGQVDTYGYWFTDRDAPSILGPVDYPVGAAHAFEIQYVLNTFDTLESRGAGQEQLDLAAHMAEYWANFAKFGDPNSTDGAAEAVNWPRYTEGGSIIRLDAPTPSAVDVDDFREVHDCSFWQPL